MYVCMYVCKSVEDQLLGQNISHTQKYIHAFNFLTLHCSIYLPYDSLTLSILPQESGSQPAISYSTLLVSFVCL